MTDNDDSVQLSEYCFNICQVLETAVRGKDVGDFNRYARMALEDLERYVG